MKARRGTRQRGVPAHGLPSSALLLWVVLRSPGGGVEGGGAGVQHLGTGDPILGGTERCFSFQARGTSPSANRRVVLLHEPCVCRGGPQDGPCSRSGRGVDPLGAACGPEWVQRCGAEVLACRAPSSEPGCPQPHTRLAGTSPGAKLSFPAPVAGGRGRPLWPCASGGWGWCHLHHLL